MVGQLGKYWRRLGCGQLFDAPAPPTNAGDPLTPAPRAQVGPLSGLSAAVGACEDLMLARTEGMEVMEPTIAALTPLFARPAGSGALICARAVPPVRHPSSPSAQVLMGCRRILRDGVRVLWFVKGLGALPARKNASVAWLWSRSLARVGVYGCVSTFYQPISTA